MAKLSEEFLKEFQDKPISELITMNDRQLNTLLLEIFNQRSQGIEPKDILEKYINMYEFFGPSKTDYRIINEYNKMFLECAPDKYSAIELSPISPFGSNTSITKLSQKNICSTTKSSEVCSDATTALTLEACKQRKERIKNPNKINEDVNLITIMKVLRMQRFDKSKGYLQHFGQFASITAGRKRDTFETEKIVEHIKLWVDFLRKLKANGFSLGELNVGICHINIIEHFIRNNYVDREIINRNSFNDFKLFKETGIDLPDKVEDYEEFTDNQKQKYQLNYIKQYLESLSSIITKLKAQYPDVNFYVEMDRKGGLGYYVGSCFHIYSKEMDYYVPLCDGGVPNWNQKLIGDKKETSIVSGIGSELILNLYRRKD